MLYAWKFNDVYKFGLLIQVKKLAALILSDIFLTSDPAPVLSPRNEEVWESGDKSPRILNLGTRWKWVFVFNTVNFSGQPRPVPLNTSLGVHQVSLDAYKSREISFPS